MANLETEKSFNAPGKYVMKNHHHRIGGGGNIMGSCLPSVIFLHSSRRSFSSDTFEGCTVSSSSSSLSLSSSSSSGRSPSSAPVQSSSLTPSLRHCSSHLRHRSKQPFLCSGPSLFSSSRSSVRLSTRITLSEGKNRRVSWVNVRSFVR